MSYPVKQNIPDSDEFFMHALDVWEVMQAAFFNPRLPDDAAKYADDVAQIRGMIPPLESLEAFHIEMNEHLLLAAVDHARIELSRWADYHLADKPDALPSRYKLAGFFGKWIAKTRPIQVLPKVVELEPAVMPKVLYSINATFAAAIVRSYLECNYVDKDMMSDLAYRLHYRDETALNISAFAEHLEVIGNFLDTDGKPEK